MNKSEARLVHEIVETLCGLLEDPSGGGTTKVPASMEGKMQTKGLKARGRKLRQASLTQLRNDAIFGSELWPLCFPPTSLSKQMREQLRRGAWQKYKRYTAKQKSMLMKGLRKELDGIGRQEIAKLKASRIQHKLDQKKADEALAAAEKTLKEHREMKALKDKKLAASVESEIARTQEIESHFQKES